MQGVAAYLGDRLEVVQYVRTLRLRLQIRLGPLGQRFKTNQLRTVSEQTLRQHQTQVRTSRLGRHGKRRAMTRLLALCVSETKVLENALGYKVKIPPVLNQFSNLSNSYKSSFRGFVVH